MYQSFVGLEIHIQLLTKTKAFCGCRASFGDEPNTNVCPVCMGYPGVLPSLNTEAVRLGYLVARTLNCTLSQKTYFDRKNYFYPDMPKNYQISQFHAPVGENGYIDFEFRKLRKKIRIKDVHLEEDAGKMIHAGDMSLLDYNRAGTPLLEIVTMPDLETGDEAEAFLLYFRRLVRYLGVCDGNMEEGSLRCDVNISINLIGKGLGTKVEIKNLNSSRFVKKALIHEIERQKEILERSGTIRQETRLWNENRDVTEVMRVKESESDYRYFPEPDLPPFSPDQEFLASVEERLVESPAARRERLIASYGLPEAQADIVCEEKETVDYYEETIALGADPQAACVWLTSDVRKYLNRTGKSEYSSPLSVARFAELLSLIDTKKIHSKIAKQVLDVIFSDDKSPSAIIKERGWEQMTTREEILPIVKGVIAENPDAVNQVKDGDAKPIAFLIGRIMAKTGGRAEPQLVQKVVNEELALSSIHVLLMGGAITAQRTGTGILVPGDIDTIRRLFRGIKQDESSLRIEELNVSSVFSEEISPSDWARLLSKVSSLLDKQTSRGIVITHGTDTLAYTASLLYWFFPSPPFPIVFVSSIVSPSTEKEEEAVKREIEHAINIACTAEPGIYVASGGKILSPLNLRFERIAESGFRNWNMTEPVYRGMPLKSISFDLSNEAALVRKMEDAADKICIIKLYPGMRSDFISNVISRRFMHVILELYGSGTANADESAYSVKNAIIEGRDRLVAFYCTSQQESPVDFSEYSTSHELWQGGAIPMGSLTTESAYTRLIACLMFADSDEETARLMEV
jgi:aspartyl-tRNA(Asn)/glutamyl-tRNA(Gln) amidotransferase subunit B